MARRHYTDNAPPIALAGAIGSADTTIVVTPSLAGYPTTTPWLATIDYGTSSAEQVLVTTVVGSTLTVTRNSNGQGAFAHPSGAGFAHTFAAQDADEANSHTNAVSGVHGVTSQVVGISDTQTLSNKTILAPQLQGAVTVKATAVGGKVFIGQNLQGGTTSTVDDAGNNSATSYTATGAVTSASASVSGLVAAGSLNVGAGKLTVDPTGILVATQVKGRLLPPSYATTAARDAAITTPIKGEIIDLAGILQKYNGTKWLNYYSDDYAPPWQSYTPRLFVNGQGYYNLGNAAVTTGRFRTMGKTCALETTWAFGTSGITGPAGQICFELPTGVAGSSDVSGWGQAYLYCPNQGVSFQGFFQIFPGQSYGAVSMIASGPDATSKGMQQYVGSPATPGSGLPRITNDYPMQNNGYLFVSTAGFEIN